MGGDANSLQTLRPAVITAINAPGLSSPQIFFGISR
jgi:hypothetical protein